MDVESDFDNNPLSIPVDDVELDVELEHEDDDNDHRESAAESVEVDSGEDANELEEKG